MTRLTPSEFERRKYKVDGQWCLLYGSDDYRKHEALEEVLRRVASAEGGLFEPVTFDGAGLSAARVLESAQTASLFGPAVTVVRSVQQMHADEQKILAERLDRIAPEALVVLVSSAHEERKPQAALVRAVEKAGTTVQFDQPKEAGARQWVIRQAERLGAAIEPAAAALLVRRVGTDLVDLSQELEKLVLFAAGERKVNRQHVEAVTSRSLDENVFHVVDGVSAGQVDRAVTALHDILSAGAEREEGIRIVSVMASHFRLIWHTKRLIEAGWRPAREGLSEEQAALVSEETARKLKGWQAGKLAEQAGRLQWPRLVEMLERLVQCDLAVKGGTDVKSGLEKLIISLSTSPRTR